MAESRTITVAGLDLAAVNSGYCRIKARAVPQWPPLEIEVLDHSPIELKDKTPQGRLHLAGNTATRVHVGDLVVLEDYAKRVGSTNTTAYECGEFVGPVKAHLWESGFDVLLIQASTMRSLLGVPKGAAGKKFILKWVEDTYGFKPPYGREKQRSDVADAFVHAYIAALWWFAKQGDIDPQILTEREKRIIFGNPDPRKTKNFVGLLDRDEILVRGRNGEA